MVVPRIERLDLGEFHGADIGGVADGHPPVGMVVRIERLVQRGHGKAIRAVLVVLAALVQHHRLLRGEALLGDGRQEIAHPVALHPEREIEGARGHDLPVVRAIRAGRSVDGPACLLEWREVAVVMVGAALEHQVFEQMREARAAAHLVPRADVIPDIDGHLRHAMVLVDQHVEAVGERLLDAAEFGTRHRTWSSGILPLLATAALWAAMETWAATRSARLMKALPATDSGSANTIGTPVSPPSRIGW